MEFKIDFDRESLLYFLKDNPETTWLKDSFEDYISDNDAGYDELSYLLYVEGLVKITVTDMADNTDCTDIFELKQHHLDTLLEEIVEFYKSVR